MQDLMQLVTTVDSQEAALKIARHAVERRLAACVQVQGPITSVYRWEGEIDMATEWRIIFKTRRAALEPLMAAVAAVHPYAVPQLVALPLPVASDGYTAWVHQEVPVDPH